MFIFKLKRLYLFNVERSLVISSVKSITDSSIKIYSDVLDNSSGIQKDREIETKNIKLFIIVSKYYVDNHMHLQKHSTTHLILILLNIYFTFILLIMQLVLFSFFLLIFNFGYVRIIFVRLNQIYIFFLIIRIFSTYYWFSDHYDNSGLYFLTNPIKN